MKLLRASRLLNPAQALMRDVDFDGFRPTHRREQLQTGVDGWSAQTSVDRVGIHVDDGRGPRRRNAELHALAPRRAQLLRTPGRRTRGVYRTEVRREQGDDVRGGDVER